MPLPTRPSEFLEWSKSHEGKKLIRFTSVSVISTIVSFITIGVVYGFKLVEGQIWATVIGNAVASVPSYYLNRKWAWGKSGRSHIRKEIIPFWSMSALGTAFSIIGAYFVREYTHAHHTGHLMTTVLLQVANIASFAIFWVLKLIVFNKIFHIGEIEEFDEHLTAEENEHPLV
ncbi:MAG: GtrA family protein [Actinomycetota bacterium]